MAALLEACSTASGALSAPFAFLCTVPGISKACATAIRQVTATAGEEVLARTAALGGAVILPEDDAFPAMLRTIPDPPPVLYLLGNASLLLRPAVAIVGSRDHSSYGGQVCRQIAGEAGRAGVVVVSGMARGLDAAAHSAALDAGGTTIGVLGNGLGVIYPAANHALYERVARDGCLVTEFPPGERPHAGSFPRRNRLISGLARVTVVIEAATGSGTMITVSTALEQGREVMAVPGCITSPVSIGTNRLIRDGASPLLETEDLLRHFPETGTATRRDPAATAGASARPLPPGLGPIERRALELFGDGPLHTDQIAGRLELPVGGVQGLLGGLELQELVTALPGGGWWELARR
ncbi:MAG: DNA-processing protein DprA [Gemmatimonadota bacterium]|nr:DNA-processing protein DprA [Gemmatimonadota bacterium]